MGVLLLRREGPRLPKRGLTCTLASLLPSRRQVPLPAEDSAPCLSKLQGVPGPLEDVEPTWLSRNPSLGGGRKGQGRQLSSRREGQGQGLGTGSPLLLPPSSLTHRELQALPDPGHISSRAFTLLQGL